MGYECDFFTGYESNGTPKAGQWERIGDLHGWKVYDTEERTRFQTKAEEGVRPSADPTLPHASAVRGPEGQDIMGTRARHASIIGLGAVAFVACGGTSSSNDTAVDLSGQTDRMATAYCEGIQGCCATASLSVDLNRCKAAFAGTVGNWFVPTGEVSFDAARADACEQGLRSLASCSYPDTDLDTDCYLVYSGSKQEGEPCVDDRECAGSDAYCNDSGRTSVCVTESDGDWGAVHLGPGDACSSTCTYFDDGDGGACIGFGGSADFDAGCYTDDGLYCTGGVCAPAKLLGESCLSDYECSTGTCLGGSCAEKSLAGGTCETASDCAADLYCDEAQTCAPRLPIGSPCTDWDQCAGADSDCDLESGEVGVCIDYSALTPNAALCSGQYGFD